MLTDRDNEKRLGLRAKVSPELFSRFFMAQVHWRFCASTLFYDPDTCVDFSRHHESSEIGFNRAPTENDRSENSIAR